MEAIHALKGKAAVSYSAIRKQMLAMYPDATNESALRLALKNGVPRGAFAKEKASYVLTAASRRHMASVDAARKASAPGKVEAPQTFETEYERQRAENVSRNREMLAMLGLASSAQPASSAAKTCVWRTKKRFAQCFTVLVFIASICLTLDSSVAQFFSIIEN